MTVTPEYLTNCEQRTIDTAHGAVEYLWIDITDKRKKDITAAAVQISLGTYETPGAWHNADLIEQNGAVWKIRAGLLIGGSLTYPAGQYFAWFKLTDSPEIIPQRSDNQIITIT
jgi:hypothetical protein